MVMLPVEWLWNWMVLSLTALRWDLRLEDGGNGHAWYLILSDENEGGERFERKMIRQLLMKSAMYTWLNHVSQRFCFEEHVFIAVTIHCLVQMLKYTNVWNGQIDSKLVPNAKTYDFLSVFGKKLTCLDIFPNVISTLMFIQNSQIHPLFLISALQRAGFPTWWCLFSPQCQHHGCCELNVWTTKILYSFTSSKVFFWRVFKSGILLLLLTRDEYYIHKNWTRKWCNNLKKPIEATSENADCILCYIEIERQI